MVQTRAHDRNERRILDDIRECGWHVIAVPEDDAGPGFTYSIGLHQTFRHPEIIIFGLEPLVGFEAINLFGQMIRQGEKLSHGHQIQDNVSRNQRRFLRVPRCCYREYLGFALWYYQGAEFPVLQCLWPDREGRYPYEVGCEDYARDPQPLIARRSEWPFRESPETVCFTTRFVIHHERPVLYVYHDEDGDWQFLCGTSTQTQDANLVCLKTMAEICDDIVDLSDLPVGWMAKRQKVGMPWNRMPIDR